MWRKIPCKLKELNLEINLACGQSFRWQNVGANIWRGPLAGHVWSLTQDDNYLHYMVHSDISTSTPPADEHSQIVRDHHTESNQNDDSKANIIARTISELPVEVPAGETFYVDILRDYFQLDVSLSELYEKWGKADPKFKSVSSHFLGVRMLRQDPVENLFSFICSSNNHISRISGMVERMCERYGKQIATVDGKSYHSFPDVDSLAGAGVEATLRELSFGYRAKYISQSAQYIVQNGGAYWLQSLRNVPYSEAKSQLMKLTGVGAKVADCVCLMSLDKHGAIPVDTHVWQIASRDYMPQLRSAKSVTDNIYNQIGNFFRDLYGDYAGWAHSVLFSADLKKFQHRKDLSEVGKQEKGEVKSKGPKRKAEKAKTVSAQAKVSPANHKYSERQLPLSKKSKKSVEFIKQVETKPKDKVEIKQPHRRRDTQVKRK